MCIYIYLYNMYIYVFKYILYIYIRHHCDIVVCLKMGYATWITFRDQPDQPQSTTKAMPHGLANACHVCYSSWPNTNFQS